MGMIPVCQPRMTVLPGVSVPAAVFEQALPRIVRGRSIQQPGVARPSLREAIKALEIIGLLECRVGDGTFV